jgi:hypothetical protein
LLGWAKKVSRATEDIVWSAPTLIPLFVSVQLEQSLLNHSQRLLRGARADHGDLRGDLGWAISTGAKRDDITSVESLKGGKIGVSRIGSGSYVMGFVLADRHGWLSSSAAPFSDTVVLHNFENLRNAANSGEADFFMWEHFTSKKFYDSGEIRRVGEIYTPWSSWKIVASTGLTAKDGGLDPRVGVLFDKLDKGVAHFNMNQEEAIAYISSSLGYTEPDAREWIKTVKFPAQTKGVGQDVVDNCVSILRKAGVLVEGKGLKPSAMIYSGGKEVVP